ncbi:hypothetical protein CWB96_03755 [Pseudoalteromonas citrea]|uniref:Uncharacterized protein n=1 Tax=Pseudoalteromonas citrea TaxID=43655 RepID=A0A5S3XSV6_9GAMM|nr:hypothetical protein [Pseudoalteromonas citrea]TMP45208.1 hypothetical protein CWB97_05255 [Pseudoalteromonas citrea]TMP61411.1 hypothetical protein CWB96_03755 [Pseudoalteromonas citrea]
MKPSNLILFSIASMAFFYIQLWDVSLTTPLHLSLLGACTVYGIYIKNINMSHIAGFIFTLTALPTIIFETGLINHIIVNMSKVLQGLIIYGTQLFFSLATISILIFRVQVSRHLSKSKNIELTNFDGVFHWIYIYISILYLSSMVEYFIKSHFNMNSWTLIYDNFEGLVYIAWALNCGALLTMMITSQKSDTRTEKTTA